MNVIFLELQYPMRFMVAVIMSDLAYHNPYNWYEIEYGADAIFNFRESDQFTRLEKEDLPTQLADMHEWPRFAEDIVCGYVHKNANILK